MQAVELKSGLVIFCPVDFPDSLRREIIEGGIGQVRDDVQVIRPEGPEREYRPTFVLAASLADPTHYEFLDQDEVDPTRQRIVDKAFRVLPTVDGWWGFLKAMTETEAMMASVTGVEAGDDWPESLQ